MSGPSILASDGSGAAGPLMLDLQGLTLTPDEAELLQRPAVGGVILFARNYSDPQQLQTLTSAIREVRPQLLIAVDHEGGRVQRFKTGFTRIPPMAVFHQLNQQDSEAALMLARDCGWLLASELIAYGIDISFTPVLDLDRQISEVIGDRAFGSEPQTVVTLASALMSGMAEAGMANTGKHFPGHGGVAADSHLTIPVDQRSFEQIEAEDLHPFAKLAQAGLDAVMPAHVIYQRCDSAPAGFSRFWLQQILRQQLGFNGVIFSDDLSMEGAVVAGSYSQRAQAAIDAGCDMVLVCNQPEAAVQVLNWLEQQHFEYSPRVASMKARASVSIEQLKADPRWLKTQQRLQQLTG
ncbi:MAG: beta-N-acetylhexosaminidase [Motiliproteus sp.]|nr:beta-N-acetylhexosaminidase [Motiliproteus sp.]MCW9051291.1 beta-N-acetylhexosaminidase [Motiliproteus sp.]